MGDRCSAVGLGRDDGLDTGCGDFSADSIGIIAFVRKQRLDPVGQHPEQRAKALRVVGLTGRQDEPERPTLSVASGMEFGGEAAARAAKALGRLIPFFSPTAQ